MQMLKLIVNFVLLFPSFGYAKIYFENSILYPLEKSVINIEQLQAKPIIQQDFRNKHL